MTVTRSETKSSNDKKAGPDETTTNGTKKNANGKVVAGKDEQELSDEDQQLKTDLELLVARLKEDQSDLYSASIDQLGSFIRTSTSSMTAVPKP